MEVVCGSGQVLGGLEAEGEGRRNRGREGALSQATTARQTWRAYVASLSKHLIALAGVGAASVLEAQRWQQCLPMPVQVGLSKDKERELNDTIQSYFKV